MSYLLFKYVRDMYLPFLRNFLKISYTKKKRKKVKRKKRNFGENNINNIAYINYYNILFYNYNKIQGQKQSS